MQLNDNHIKYDAAEHRYFNENGKELRGITSTIVRWMFPDTYANVPQEVLDKAKEHGSYVHSCIEMTEAIGATKNCPESQEFLDMLAENRMSVVKHEYVVTCFDEFASPIDVVLQDENGDIWLADIKCTSALHKEKVQLQLSIYAYMFELCNPTLNVKGVIEIWLPKEQYRKNSYQGWQKLSRTSYEETEKTIRAFIAGEKAESYLPFFSEPTSTLPIEVKDILVAIAEQERIAKEINERTAKMKEALLQAFETYGGKKFETSDIIITKVEATTRTSVDSKKLKEAYPTAYEECLKTSNVKPSIKITLK